MPLSIDSVRKLATVATVREVRPIEGADSIEQAKIRNWTIVLRKGEFQEGDQVVYFEEDSALPLADLRFAFLEPRGSKEVDGENFHVLKIARLRGVYSQGLALPLEQFRDDIIRYEVQKGNEAAEGSNWVAPEGMDVSPHLGILKWDPPLVASGGGQAKGPFPTAYIAKSDAERVQNLDDNAWQEILKHEWVATEKLDGTSLTVYRKQGGEVGVCSRNLELQEGDNLYWTVTKAYRLADLLEPGEALQAEIVGPGIQKNRQNVPETRPYIFNFVHNRRAVPRAHWSPEMLALSVPVLPLVLPATQDEALSQVDGLKSAVDKNRLAEGVVWHTVSGEELEVTGNRSCFKAVSNKYLTKG